MTDATELAALLRIRAVPGIGDTRLTALLKRHGSASGAWDAIRRERPDAAAGVRAPVAAARIKHALRSVGATPDIEAIAAYDPAWPAALLDLHDPPPLIFVRGDTSLLDMVGVAIVGTRACTEYGADVARAISESVAREGIAVISGVAHGIDRHAHEAALDCGGATIGVIGCGIDVVYPHQHRGLYDRIASHGLLVSEFLPGQPALPHHFPRRNRIIAALSRAVVVIEAPARSGALITADHALDIGREVFAVPGPIGRRTSEGTNALIRDGATVVTTATDVVEILAGSGVGTSDSAGRRREGVSRASDRRAPGSGKGTDGPGTEQALSRTGPAAAMEAVLTDEPAHVDDLAVEAGLAPAHALAALLELELAGRAILGAGGRYRRASHVRNRLVRGV